MNKKSDSSGRRSLASLVAALQPLAITGFAELEILGLQHDSRLVRPGDLFVAVPGQTTDGTRYLDQALARGAVAVVSERPLALAVPCLLVAQARLALAQAAAWFHDYPSRKLTLVGVTGTNGKTTTCYLIRYLLDRVAGSRTGLIGSISNCIGAERLPSRFTTPDALELHALLDRMVASGVEYTVMEVSSHALAQERVASCRFDAAIFTNLTHDHLDFHKSLDHYREAKGKLFHTHSDEGSQKIVNGDDPFGRALVARAGIGARMLTYGLDPGNELFAGDIAAGSAGTSCTLHYGPQRQRLRLPLLGIFNLYNALAAISYGLTLGLELPRLAAVLEAFPGVPGRLQPIDMGQPFKVFIDYAHTPDGLEQALKTLRSLHRGRLVTVFGCTGDRDTAKRPVMGEIAARYSDFLCLTSDDPHHEDPAEIIRQIELGVLACGGCAGRDYLVEIDRASAVEAALCRAEADDVVLIAGKGHETVQVFADRRVSYSDEKTVRGILATLLGQRSAG